MIARAMACVSNRGTRLAISISSKARSRQWLAIDMTRSLDAAFVFMEQFDGSKDGVIGLQLVDS
jgi:hypothetical protein